MCFSVGFQSSVLPSLTLASASRRGQCDGTFCFAIFSRVFDVLPLEVRLFVEVGLSPLTHSTEADKHDKHGVYGRRELLSQYSAALAPSHNVQSCLRSLGLWTTEGRPRLPLPWPPGRSSTPAVANDAPSRQRHLRHNRKSPEHTRLLYMSIDTPGLQAPNWPSAASTSAQ